MLGEVLFWLFGFSGFLVVFGVVCSVAEWFLSEGRRSSSSQSFCPCSFCSSPESLTWDWRQLNGSSLSGPQTFVAGSEPQSVRVISLRSVGSSYATK